MKRDPQSHKGDNGKVAVVGGSSTMHGAPLFAALAAEASGVDLIHVCLPRCHAEVAKASSLNFQVHPFAGDDPRPEDTGAILELLSTMDCAVLGPGIAQDHASLQALQELCSRAPCPLVPDASALLPSTLSLLKEKVAVLTPHPGELKRMGLDPEDIGDAARDHRVVIFLKGSVDRIAGPDGSVQDVKGGNAGLTTGGTGDVLAGLIAGLIAQKMKPLEAAVTAARIMKEAATALYPQKGYALTAQDVIGMIPELVKDAGM